MPPADSVLARLPFRPASRLARSGPVLGIDVTAMGYPIPPPRATTPLQTGMTIDASALQISSIELGLLSSHTSLATQVAVVLAVASHCAPFPDAGMIMPYVFEHSASQIDHAPMQSTSGGQSPSPGWHAVVAASRAGHELPCPDCARATEYALSSYNHKRSLRCTRKSNCSGVVSLCAYTVGVAYRPAAQTVDIRRAKVFRRGTWCCVAVVRPTGNTLTRLKDTHHEHLVCKRTQSVRSSHGILTGGGSLLVYLPLQSDTHVLQLPWQLTLASQPRKRKSPESVQSTDGAR